MYVPCIILNIMTRKENILPIVYPNQMQTNNHSYKISTFVQNPHQTAGHLRHPALLLLAALFAQRFLASLGPSETGLGSHFSI